MNIHFITNDNGKRTHAVIPFKEYERLMERIEIAEDVAAYDQAMAEDSETVPQELVDRLIEGDNPITVWREYRGLTATQLAKKSGVTASMISQIENGKKEASVKVMKSIAEALGVTLDDVC